MSWQHITTPSPWPEVFDEEAFYPTFEGSAPWHLRIKGKKAFLKTSPQGHVYTLPGLGQSHALFQEPDLSDADLTMACAPTHYVMLVSRDEVQLEDITCGPYEIFWFSCSENQKTLHIEEHVFDGGFETLPCPEDRPSERLLLYLRRIGL